MSLNQGVKSNPNPASATIKGSIVPVKVRDAGIGSCVEFESLLSLCERSLPGFRDQYAHWARQIFPQQSRLFNSSFGGGGSDLNGVGVGATRDRYDMLSDVYFGAPASSDKVYVPTTAQLVCFPENVKYPALKSFLEANRLQLAPVEVLLSTLLTNLVSHAYHSVAFDGSKITTSEYNLRIPGPSYTCDRTVIAAGGHLRDGDGITRDALLGARTGARGIEFFLPYVLATTTGGWIPGTLFLVQPLNGSHI